MITLASNRLRTGFVMIRLLRGYLLFGALKHLVPLRWLARWAWCRPAGLRDRDAEQRLVARIVRLRQLTGYPDRDCLQRSLLLYHVLSRAGADPTLVVGFCQMNGQMLGHAWVIVDGHAVIDVETDLLGYLPVFCFGKRGGLIPIPTTPRLA
jgi:hypothetical protein